MSFERQHENLTVRFTKNPNTGRIVKAVLRQVGPGDYDVDAIQLSPHQLYALVDNVAVADPEGWARRFDPRDAIERHLRQVADYFREREEANRWHTKQTIMADTFALAVTRVMEEIEALYEDQPEELTEPERHQALDAIQRLTERRNA